MGEGWAVRGTSRSESGLAAVESAGIEPALADPQRPGTLLDLVGDVAVVVYALGSAIGDETALAAIHGDRLERLLEKLVDTPVRGFVYEAAGSAETALLERGARIVRAAASTWRIPCEVVTAEHRDAERWCAEMGNAVLRAVSRPLQPANPNS
jgi:uncharacterized protein YbjT (DUF2867 family)